GSWLLLHSRRAALRLPSAQAAAFSSTLSCCCCSALCSLRQPVRASSFAASHCPASIASQRRHHSTPTASRRIVVGRGLHSHAPTPLRNSALTAALAISLSWSGTACERSR